MLILLSVMDINIELFSLWISAQFRKRSSDMLMLFTSEIEPQYIGVIVALGANYVYTHMNLIFISMVT